MKIYDLIKKRGIFDTFLMFLSLICRNELPYKKTLKNPRNPRKSWLTILDFLRKNFFEEVLSYSPFYEELKDDVL